MKKRGGKKKQRVPVAPVPTTGGGKQRRKEERKQRRAKEREIQELKEMQEGLGMLSDDVLADILQFLQPEEVMEAKLVCKRWYAICRYHPSFNSYCNPADVVYYPLKSAEMKEHWAGTVGYANGYMVIPCAGEVYLCKPPIKYRKRKNIPLEEPEYVRQEGDQEETEEQKEKREIEKEERMAWPLEEVKKIRLTPALQGGCKKQIWWEKEGLLLLLAQEHLFFVDIHRETVPRVMNLPAIGLAEANDMALQEGEGILYVVGRTPPNAVILKLENLLFDGAKELKITPFTLPFGGKLSAVWVVAGRLWFTIQKDTHDYNQWYAKPHEWSDVLYFWDMTDTNQVKPIQKCIIFTGQPLFVLETPRAGGQSQIIVGGKGCAYIFDIHGNCKAQLEMFTDPWSMCIGYHGHLCIATTYSDTNQLGKILEYESTGDFSWKLVRTVRMYEKYPPQWKPAIRLEMWNGWLICVNSRQPDVWPRESYLAHHKMTIILPTNERKYATFKVKGTPNSINRFNWTGHVIMPDGRIFVPKFGVIEMLAAAHAEK